MSSRWLTGERIILTLWVGGMWAIGYIVAPALFSSLDDRALAGSLAGVMFRSIAWIGLFCAILLLAGNQLRSAGRRLNWRAVVLIVMLVIIVIGQFVLAPLISSLRAAGAANAAAFAWAHGAASLLYMVNSLLGLLLVVREPG
jgi:uncharacterized membrane protein